ncbi:MAG: glucose-6-phosphate isomerase [Thaumarchaeota archaeon]|nr:glucose-6-phosphate isomerase [Nitrososphaerota archaeon]
MFQVYDRWPEISKERFDANLEEIDYDKISYIVFSGMGGSGALSDIFSSIFSKTNVHVDVIKGYLLPKTVNSETLVVTTSISGNTNETLTIMKSALDGGSKVVSFSSGGKIEQFCAKKGLKNWKIPMQHSPRASFVSFLYSMLKVLNPVIPIQKDEITESIDQMNVIRKKIFSENLNETNPSLNLSEWITDIPVIYYPWGLQAAAIRFKNSLQENAKHHAMIEDVIETCHNGIVTWSKPSRLKPILIQGEDDHIKTKERWKILKEFFQKENIEYWDVKSAKGGILSKLINLIYLLDYSTIYLAANSKIDPTPIEPIDYIKKRL